MKLSARRGRSEPISISVTASIGSRLRSPHRRSPDTAEPRRRKYAKEGSNETAAPLDSFVYSARVLPRTALHHVPGDIAQLCESGLRARRVTFVCKVNNGCLDLSPKEVSQSSVRPEGRERHHRSGRGPGRSRPQSSRWLPWLPSLTYSRCPMEPPFLSRVCRFCGSHPIVTDKYGLAGRWTNIIGSTLGWGTARGHASVNNRGMVSARHGRARTTPPDPQNWPTGLSNGDHLVS